MAGHRMTQGFDCGSARPIRLGMKERCRASLGVGRTIAYEVASKKILAVRPPIVPQFKTLRHFILTTREVAGHIKGRGYSFCENMWSRAHIIISFNHPKAAVPAEPERGLDTFLSLYLVLAECFSQKVMSESSWPAKLRSGLTGILPFFLSLAILFFV